MALINIRNLTFGYDGSEGNLFEDISVGIDTSWRLALGGRNGRGKTTFFMLLKGELPYEGTITGVPQTESFPRDEITSEDWRIRKELNLMGADPDIMYRHYETLSGGERTKLMLADLFASDGVYPLIDEPTNHLDAEGREAVARYLSGKEGFILISHDRSFLDRCTDHTLMITKTGVELTSSTFSTWWDNNEKRLEGERARNEQLRREISGLNESMRKNASWSKEAEKAKLRSNNPKGAEDHFRRAYEGSKSAKMMSLAKNLQNRSEKKIEEKSALLKDVEKAEELKITESSHHSKTPVILKNVTVMRDDFPICEGINLTVNNGSRIRLTGSNGCGKSTLIKYILGRCEPSLFADESISAEGDIYFAKDIRVSYVSQDTSLLKGDLGSLAQLSGLDRTLFSTILVKMGFTKDMLERDCDTLSLGQKKCVMIALSLCEHADIYLWDEPLNYVDIYMRREIERLVKGSDITLLFVEHDEAFANEVAQETCRITSANIM
ncbi:MAG: ABC-F family ATP-binding cassette domain-containing protein [Clostridiales bacterium]|nr:ABC-F family ATP-binding cassette domain-containing protein [Clostridiales bacterium]